MALVTDDAITLAVSDYSETSQVVTLLTRRSGKVRVLAKGSKRPKNTFGGPIDRLQSVEAVFSVRPQGGLGQLAELSERETLPGLRRDLKAFYAASCACELVLAAIQELDPCPETFEILNATLRRLSCGGDSAILLYHFEVRFLAQLGLMPDLGGCVSCRRRRRLSQGGFFLPEAGGLLCRKCQRDRHRGVSVCGKALDALAFLAAAADDQLPKVRLAPRTASDVRKLLSAYWTHALGRPPRAMRWAP